MKVNKFTVHGYDYEVATNAAEKASAFVNGWVDATDPERPRA
jgi:hypothetical protein